MKQIGYEGPSDGIGQSDKQGGHKSTSDRADAANGNDHERGNQNVFSHPDLNGEDRRLH